MKLLIINSLLTAFIDIHIYICTHLGMKSFKFLEIFNPAKSGHDSYRN
jgi:hypothetical protein